VQDFSAAPRGDRPAYERSPHAVFISSRSFADDEDGSMMIPLTEDEMIP
jgi:hypothetical protein